jgi:triosephosphate isomerase
MRQGLVVGNWKMHGSRASVSALVAELASSLTDTKADVAVCPPFVYLQQLETALQGSKIALGVQNISDQTEGAFTGEVAASMAADFACRYALVGHSERRSLYGETDQQVAVKFQLAQASGLQPILCIGESLEQREAGQTLALVEQQIAAVTDLLGVSVFDQAVIAYEPVWAIGTGKTASPEQAQEVHAFIRGQIAKLDESVANKLRILYGGSVKAANAAELFSKPDIDGALVGGASLKADEFSAICNAA